MIGRREAIQSRDGRFQVLASLLTSRNQRHRRRLFVVQGVRAINQARAAGWPVQAAAWRGGPRLSRWATQVLDDLDVEVSYEVDPVLMAELSDKEDPSELVLIARRPDWDLSDLRGRASEPVVIGCLDRIQSPGNLGSIIRSADALGVAGLVLLGHCADPWDPRSVRASTGSVFSVPVVSVAGISQARAGMAQLWPGVRWLGADENGRPLGDGPTAPVTVVSLGSEGRGLSQAVRDGCEELVAIPMSGTASSLNVSVAAGILFHQLRQPYSRG